MKLGNSAPISNDNVLARMAPEVVATFSPSSAPAGIPFKADRGSCEASGRTWQEGGCLDFGHDPTV